MFMHDSRELPLERRRQIADRLVRGLAVVAAPLAAEFGVSEDAIRRDLRALAEEGLCKRVYGGALPLSPASSSIKVRSDEDIDRKRALAREAAGLIGGGQTLFLDTGSTNLQLAAELPEVQALTVITNSMPVAAALTNRRDIMLVVIGGSVSSEVGGCIGARSIAELRRFRIDLCFLGACAISVEHGLAGFDMADVDFKRSLLDVSETAALMVTNAKLETAAPFCIGSLSDVAHLVVEHDAPPPIVSALRATGAAIRIAGIPRG
jgi:DeoR/GlpR family transcriptional regulator of sugar metabolism